MRLPALAGTVTFLVAILSHWFPARDCCMLMAVTRVLPGECGGRISGCKRASAGSQAQEEL